MGELERLTLKLRDILDGWRNPPTGRAVVGRLWWGNHERWPTAINTPDVEMSNALWVLQSPELRDEVLERFDWLAVDSADLHNHLAAQVVGLDVVKPVERAARWLYLNKTFWWPHLAHGWGGRTGTTDWEMLLSAWRNATKCLRDALIATNPVERFVEMEDRKGLVLIFDLTAVEPRRDRMSAWLKLARRADTLAIVPDYETKSRTLDVPPGWHTERIGGADGTIFHSSKPFRPGYQQTLIPWSEPRA